jgi:riboflavin biosynthesis pyrimidine reductase
MDKDPKRPPKVTNVMATSIDGKIAEFPEQTDQERVDFGFSSEEDREFVKSQLLDADAVIVGANTLRASGKFWSMQNRRGRYPVWAIFSNHPQNLEPILSGQPEVPKILVSKNELGTGEFLPGVEKIYYQDGRPGKILLDHLTQRNYIENILVFGGGSINRIFYDENLVDELKITLSPFIFGSKEAPNFIDPGICGRVRLCLKSSQFSNNHVFLSYTVEKQ